LLLPRLLRDGGQAGIESIMVNCNPETVSTDYDTSDRLYFEPLTAEDVLEILDVEHVEGHAGRRDRPVRWADAAQAGAGAGRSRIPILGTSPDAIDLAEDRERSRHSAQRSSVCRNRSPKTASREAAAKAIAVAARIGYPVLTAPVLRAGRPRDADRRRSGAARKLCREAVQVSGDSPVLMDRYLRDAIEVDVDASLRRRRASWVAGNAWSISRKPGIHSGDSACSIPPYSAAIEGRNHRRSSVRPKRWRARSKCAA
jgi:carbamoyl-phosphate synthase large subunit